MSQEVSFNEFLKQRIVSGPLPWERSSKEFQALQEMLAAMNGAGWTIRHAFEFDNFMKSRPTMFYERRDGDRSCGTQILWDIYRAAYPDLVDDRMLVV